MRKYALTLMLASFMVLFTNFHTAENKGKLIIHVDNIIQNQGMIWVGIYNSQNYLVKEEAIVSGFMVEKQGQQFIEFTGIEYGTYAVALFHDLNGNGEMDKNLIGIPSEPYAFSQTPRTKWRLPRFHEIKFTFKQNHQILKTRLKKWGEK